MSAPLADLAAMVEGPLTPLHRLGARVVRQTLAPPSAQAPDPLEPVLIADLRSALGHIDPDPREDWVRFGQALCSLGQDGYRLWIEWSKGSLKFEQQDAADTWASFTGSRTGYGAIFVEAERRGWVNPARSYWANVEMVPGVAEYSAAFAERCRARAADATAQNGLRYRLLSGSDLNALPPVEWRVRGIFPAHGVGAVFGPSASGKTFLAFDMAAAIAHGESWFGCKVKNAPVVYAALEGESGFKARIAAWEKSAGRPLPDGMRLVMQAFDLTTADDVEALATAALTLGSTPVIFIDTLNRAAPHADENSSKDMGGILEGAKRLQALTDGLVILVHHTGKDAGKGLRGHSSLFAAMDGVIEVTRANDQRWWNVNKSKDASDGREHAFRLRVVDLGEDDGEPVSSCVIDQADAGAPSAHHKPNVGKNQRSAVHALDAMFDAAGSGTGEAVAVDFDDAVSCVAAGLDCEPGRHSERAKAAIKGLVKSGMCRQRENKLWRA